MSTPDGHRPPQGRETAYDIEHIYDYERATGLSTVPLRLRRATLAYIRAADEDLTRDVGLSSARFSILATVAASPGITNSLLAELTGQRPHSALITARALEREGLLERRHGYRRERLHYVTAAGKDVVGVANATMRHLHEHVLGELSADQVTALESALTGILRALDLYGSRAAPARTLG